MARTFNGTSDSIVVNCSNLSVSTMACWFRPANITAALVACSLGNAAGSDDDRIALTANGSAIGDPVQIQAVVNGGAAVMSSSGTMVANTWQHGAGVTASSNSRTAYRNGTAGTTNTTARAMSGLNRFIVGARYSAGSLGAYFDGQLAEVGLWDVVLSAGEIAALAAGVRPLHVRPESLLSYFPLIRDIKDLVGGGTPTVSGTSVYDHPRAA
jgi:hypothetical protein